MEITVTNTSSVNFEGRKYASLATLLAARRVLGANRFKFAKTNQPLNTALSKAYTLTGNLMDEIVATTIGASSVVNSQGFGVIFDNILVDEESGKVEISENKLVSSIVSASGIVEEVSKISVAGGVGITLAPGKKTFFQPGNIELANIQKTAENKVDVSKALSTVEVTLTKDFINNLIINKDNQAELKRLIGSNRSKAAIALRNNFELKSSDIRIVLNIGGKAVIRSIGWTWKDIQKNPKAKISVIPDGKGGVNFNIFFTSALVKEALNKAETIANQRNLEISDSLAKTLADQFAAFSPDVIKFLDSFGINNSYTYDVGSLLVGKGKITDRSQITRVSNQVNRQQFISGVQWTALTQKRLGETMLRLGEAEPPELKERTGRFRSSVQVFANYRTRLLQYTYNPLYRSLQKYGYKPDLQVETAIREVAQQLYAQKFNITRVSRV